MEAPLTKDDIRQILGRHPGSKAELARRCGNRSTAAVSTFLKHGTSAPMMEQAQILCRELLEKEERDRLAKGEANGPSVRSVIDQLRNKKPDQPDQHMEES